MADADYSLLRKAAEVTPWPHGVFAELTGIPRSTVQAIIQGRCREYLTGPQIAALLGAVRLHRDRVIQGVEEMETFA